MVFEIIMTIIRLATSVSIDHGANIQTYGSEHQTEFEKGLI